MTFATNETYMDDPDYPQMMADFQMGNWNNGLITLNRLIQNYPLEQELRRLRQEMQLKASVSAYEAGETRSAKRQKLVNLAIRIGIAVLIVGVIFAGFRYFSGWIQQQMDTIQLQVSQERRNFEIESKINDAQILLSSYRYQEARQVIEEVKALDAENPKLAALLEQADQQEKLSQNYDQGIEMKSQGDVNGALAVFQQIEAENPNYLDVTLQIRELQTQFTLSDIIQAGDEAVRQGNWEEAISKYEEVRNWDPMYQKEVLDERLYNSYLNQANVVLEEQPDSVEALVQAREYYAKALALRPQDKQVFEELADARQTVADRLYNQYIELAKEVIFGGDNSLEAFQKAEEYFAMAQAIRPDDPNVQVQRSMAAAFIQAQGDLANNKLDAAIDKLMFVYEQDMDYAGGAARQALYDAYIARGDRSILNGRLQSAQTDFQQAVTIAQLRPDSLIRLFEAQVRVGDALGLMGNHQTAVFQYRSALDQANILETIVLASEVDSAIRNAEVYAQRGRWRNAYTLYHQALPQVIDNLATLTVLISDKDYLAQIANQYQTTLGAILAANNLTDPQQISVGDKIIIPYINTP
jgi:tetratricopeptide (TPR) repeat protein